MHPDIVLMVLNAPRAMAGAFLLPALAIIGVILVTVFVVVMLRRMRRLEAELAALRAEHGLTRDEAAPASPTHPAAVQPTERR